MFVVVVIAVIAVSVLCWYCWPRKSKEQFTIQQPDMKMVLYYADWCGWSSKFLPVWSQFVSQAESRYPQIQFEKVECTNQKCQVKGFPTIVMHTQSGAIEFDGDRSVSGLIEFVEQFI